MNKTLRILSLLLVLAMIFGTLCACKSNDSDNEETDPENVSESEETKDNGDSESEESDEADDSGEEEETTGEGEETTAEEETTAPAEDTTAPVTTPPVSTTPPVTTDPPVTNNSGEELAGKGSATDPYLEIPTVGTNSMSITTVSIPAGASKFYGIQRIGGMVVTINNANAYIVCNGTRYDAQGGVLSFVAPAALASDYVTLEIGNKGGSAAAFTLVFTNLEGTQANPKIVSAGTISTAKSVSLAAEDSDGYTYKYKAESTGKIRFYMTASVTSIMSVTNNRNSAQRTTESDSQTDSTGTYIELEVNAGDELIIIVGAKPNQRGKYPATTISWYGKYI